MHFGAETLVCGRVELAVQGAAVAVAERTTAADAGDHYLVNGQKMWCTGGGLPDTTVNPWRRGL